MALEYWCNELPEQERVKFCFYFKPNYICLHTKLHISWRFFKKVTHLTKTSHIQQCKSFLSYLNPLTVIPLVHKARPSSPHFQRLGRSQNSLGPAQDVEVYFSSPLFSRCFHLAEEKYLHVCVIAPSRSDSKVIFIKFWRWSLLTKRTLPDLWSLSIHVLFRSK